MPRPKPNKASPTFISQGDRLSEAAKTKLIELLGYGKVDLLEESVRHQLQGMKILERSPGAPLLLVRDPDAQGSVEKTDVGLIILDVQQALGLYVDGQQHLDYIPRPADYVAAFKPINRDAESLLKRLTAWTGFYRDQFKIKGADIDAIEKGLNSLVEASNAVLKDMKARSCQ